MRRAWRAGVKRGFLISWKVASEAGPSNGTFSPVGSGASGFGGGSGPPPGGRAEAMGTWSPVVYMAVVFPLKDCFCFYLDVFTEDLSELF